MLGPLYLSSTGLMYEGYLNEIRFSKKSDTCIVVKVDNNSHENSFTLLQNRFFLFSF